MIRFSVWTIGCKSTITLLATHLLLVVVMILLPIHIIYALYEQFAAIVHTFWQCKKIRGRCIPFRAVKIVSILFHSHHSVRQYIDEMKTFIKIIYCIVPCALGTEI